MKQLSLLSNYPSTPETPAVSLGSYALRKHGPENVTIHQLLQAEDDGAWSELIEPPPIAEINCLEQHKFLTELRAHAMHMCKRRCRSV